MKQKILTLLLTLLVSTMSFAQSGTCGTNLTWNLSDGVLTISGTGAMTDFSNYSSVPWSSNRNNIVEVVISNGVTSIGKYAFYNCSGLKSVTIGESVTSIKDYAFRGCNNLTSVIWNAKECADFGLYKTPFYNKDSSNPNGTNDYDIRPKIISFSFGNNVKYIPAYLCSGLSALTAATIPNSVTGIGKNAFSGCSGMTTVTISNSLTTIENNVFSGCSSLTSVTIPNSVTGIGENAFNGCSELTSVTIGNSVTTIAESAFKDCSSLTSIEIPNSVESIDDNAFYACKSLKSVIIGENVTSIGTNVFMGCHNLTSFVWNAKNIGFHSDNNPFCHFVSGYGYSYDLRKQITSFTFGDNVEYISGFLCSGMSNLTYITIGKNVTGIGNNAFYGCSSLKSDINLNGVTTIGNNAFYGCSSLKSDINLNSVTTIGNNAFQGCCGLTKVAIGDDATSIGQEAFRGCTYLEDITIGSSIGVNGIGNKAFSGCPYLMRVTCKAEYPPVINENVFAECGVLGGIDLYVPKESVKRYQKADVWSEFNIIGTNLDDDNLNAVENIFLDNQASLPANKYISNGILYIYRNGIRYTTQGQRLD